MPIFETTMSNKWIGSEAKSFDDYIGLLEKHVKMLKEMRAAGVRMEPLSDDGYATFITEDPNVAGRFGILPKRNRAMKTEKRRGRWLTSLIIMNACVRCWVGAQGRQERGRSDRSKYNKRRRKDAAA